MPEALSVVCQNLVFKRGDRAYLDDVTFSLPQAKLMGLIGHNGAGKSTLLKVILGLLKPFSGSVTVLGGRPGSQPLQVGYLPENVSFYNHMTVGDHLRYFAALKHIGPSRIRELSDELGLGEVAHQKLGQCSKGQRQRLGLAQALLTRPELLILDEPTVGLDPAASLLMYRELSKLRDAGCSVIVCTHELALVESYLDTALLLAHGKMRAFGALHELTRQADLPVNILHVRCARALEDKRFEGCVVADGLRVAEHRLTEVLEILTQQYRCFDFEVKKADLGEIFRYFVLEDQSVKGQ